VKRGAFALVFLCVMLLGCIHTQEPEEFDPETYAGTAKSLGWATEHRRGAEILRAVAEAAAPHRKLDIAAYRGEKVAFLGGTAPPGGSSDLLTWDGFYLRVVNPENRDLRPQAVAWEAMVRGVILQVFVENRIIVLRAAGKDYVILDTQ